MTERLFLRTNVKYKYHKWLSVREPTRYCTCICRVVINSIDDQFLRNKCSYWYNDKKIAFLLIEIQWFRPGRRIIIKQKLLAERLFLRTNVKYKYHQWLSVREPTRYCTCICRVVINSIDDQFLRNKCSYWYNDQKLPFSWHKDYIVTTYVWHL